MYCLRNRLLCGSVQEHRTDKPIIYTKHHQKLQLKRFDSQTMHVCVSGKSMDTPNNTGPYGLLTDHHALDRLSPDNSIRLSVDPSVLNRSGEWIKVYWEGVDLPSESDWVGVFLLPSVNDSIDPKNHAPTKYQVCSFPGLIQLLSLSVRKSWMRPGNGAIYLIATGCTCVT